MAINKCLYCYNPIKEENDFHAKCAKSFFGSSIAPLLPYTLDQMAILANNVVERSISVTGVQTKLSMSIINDVVGSGDPRFTIIGAMGGYYILKPPSGNYVQMPENEHVTMRIAKAFGIRVVTSSLIRLQSGELSFITKRIDRLNNGQKVHMLDMLQITEAFDKYKSSMERIGKAIHAYSANTLLDKIFYFELSLL